jgi:hypothetical protein
MTARIPRKPRVNVAIHPQLSYRLTDPVAIHVIGLGPTQQQEAIARGELPVPPKLTPSGRARAWIGQQLLDIQTERLKRAQAEVRPPVKKKKSKRIAAAEAKTSLSDEAGALR